ncbi:MAG: protein kinase [Deltaproteobacteria bacterium]|nr:protein kinase [Deltaproteobacteria bacterium]
MAPAAEVAAPAAGRPDPDGGGAPSGPSSTAGPEAAPPRAIPIRVVYALLALICVGSTPAVQLLARDRVAANVATATLALQAALGFALAFLHRSSPRPARRALQLGMLVAIGTLTAGIGWFFGPNSGLAAMLTLLIVLTGVLYGAEGVRFPYAEAWAAYAATALSQAALTMLVLAGALPDRSLLPVVVPGHPPWHHVAAHAALQAVYLAAFLAGRAFQRRYRELARQVVETLRAAARRTALVDEARSEYRRALAVGRHGIFSGHTVGDYRLGEVLGRGGMGEVYDAVRTDDGTAAAVKLLRGDRLGDRDAVERFLHETEIVARVRSPHVARVLGSSRRDESIPYIAMERLEGRDLAAMLHERRGPLDPDEARRLACDVAAALDAVHASGVVHLDVGPRNILRVEGPGGAPVWKLLDFGLAQLELARAPGSRAAGTLRYLAPERLGGAYADARADVYGMCASLYAAVTGRDPYADAAPEALPRLVPEAMPVRPSVAAPVPDAVEAVLRIGLARAPGERWATALELRDAFLAALDGALEPGIPERAARLPPWGGGVRKSAPPGAPHGAGERAPVTAGEDRIGEAATPDRATAAAGVPARPGAVAAAEPASTLVERRPAVPAAVAASGAVATFAATSPAAEQPVVPSRTAVAPVPAASPAADRPASDSRAARAGTVDSRPADDSSSATAWQAAYRAKMRGFVAAVVLACAAGAVLLGWIARERGPLLVAWACLAGVAGAAWLHDGLVRRRRTEAIYWPWAIAGCLSVGPAFAFGLHSGFAAVLALGLFAGGMFRGSRSAPWLDRRSLVLAALIAAHTAVFVLVMTGTLGDDGNVAVRQAGVPVFAPMVDHVLLMGIYFASFVAGGVVDRAYQTLTDRGRGAALDAARKEGLLATARAELDRARGDDEGGMFTGLRVGGYGVGRLLGRGGMGEVYEARRIGDEARVALKVVRGDRVGDPVFLELFHKEARALRRIESPYVARVLEVGGIEEEIPFIAMEYIAGRSLARVLRERERLEPGEAREMIRDVTRGLSDVHHAGVVHRDIKPQNVIRTDVEGGPRWKLVDFGGARFLDAGSAVTTRLIVGTAAYMSPEHAAGEPVDARSDLYSLCLVLYRALVGRPAFTVHDPEEMVRRAAAEGPPDPRACADVSRPLALALRLGLASRPDDRPASALELAALFDQAFSGRLDAAWRKRAADVLRREPWGSRSA